MATKRTEVICDLAEVYHIMDYRRVPVSLLGTLVSGLGHNSRLAMSISGRKASMETIWLVKLHDLLGAVFEDKSSPYEPIIGHFIEIEQPEEEKKFASFNSVEDYEKARAKIINKMR